MTDEDAILAANAAYYHAFATPDFAAMSRIWADDAVSCIHPGWPALIGREAVLESLPQHPAQPQPGADRASRRYADRVGEQGRVLCVELVSGAAMALAATNCFRRIDGEWRMIHHQASPIASLLAEATPPSQRLN